MIEFTIPALSIPSVRLRAFERVRENWQEIAIIAFVTIVAAIPRLARLTAIPAGLHGDEAWTGLDAQRILDHGLIGPYVTSALGQPAGPLYFVAPFVAIFGQTIFSIRFAMALLGVATIPFAYGAFRVMFNRTVGTFAALLLAVSLWHIHYSRIAFMVVSWPLVEMITILLFFLALRTQRWLYFGLAGMTLGMGVYTYNAYPVFIIAFGAAVAWTAAFHQKDLVKFGKQVGLLAIVALVVALPLIRYATDSSNDYTSHHKLVSVFETSDWKRSGTAHRINILWSKDKHFSEDAFWYGSPDFADGAGWQPMVDHVSVGLLVIGALMAIWGFRKLPYMTLLIMVVLLPAGTIVTTQGQYRQTLSMVPFLAGLEALPLAFVWGRAHTFPPLLRGLAFFAIGSVLAAITILNMTGYFGDFPDSDAGKYTFGQEYTDAIQAVNKLPGNPYVYLYSNRWGINYETRLYLAPNWRGEDRSEEYSTDKTVTYQTDRKQDVVYVFLGKYLDGINEAARLYPGGTRYEKKFGNEVPEYRLYHLPGLKPGETPAAPLPTFAPTPTPTPRAGGDVRDRTRQSDLQRLQQILEQYKTKHGTYPSNNGGIQTLCVYKKEDVGCKLEEIQKPLPVDPLPPPTDNGYFYSSDGKTYEIYSLRESNVLPPCSDHPEHLARLPGILCVKGP